MATISETFAQALEHHQAGRLPEAEQLYRQILAVDSDHPGAWHLLGVAHAQRGQYQVGVECLQRALTLLSHWPEAHFNLGNAWKEQGKLEAAVACYQQALQGKPDYVEAHQNLALAQRGLGQLAAAAACYRRVLQLQPNSAETHNNLGTVLAEQGQFPEAILCFRRVLVLQPDHAIAYNNLGNALQAQGQVAEAITCYQRALQVQPALAEAHNNLGLALQAQGDLDAAVACFRRALEVKADYADAHHSLGDALQKQGQFSQAIECYRRALELQPNSAEILTNLGHAWLDLGELTEAIASYQRVLDLQPDFAGAHSNLANALKDQGRLDEAIAYYRRALQLQPDAAGTHNNLGIALLDQGQLAEAIACFKQALELRPDFAEAHSNLVYTLNFCPSYQPPAILEAHRRWNEQHAEPLAQHIQPHANERSPDRRLRVGYVSPDFRLHPVGRFLLPLLESHDHGRFDIFAYASVRVPDVLTDRCRAQVDVWRNVVGLSDEQLADAIRQDRIDILVDLTMHMGGSRLPVFARKPAPVQVTYLAYCGTTGLTTMDYRLTDPYLDPPGQDEGCYSEQSIRLPETYWCYQPPIQAPAVHALPALRAGHVTFGCLNNFCKVTAPALATWCRLLQTLPTARLLLHAHGGSHRDRVREFMAQQGVSPERLTFVEKVPLADYFRTYERIDVALDPFPYGGGTTTCDALWMGVPVVSLVGQTAVGRGGLSILSNARLADWATYDQEHYVRVAAELAGDWPRLSAWRATLRERMLQSVLMNAPRFARHVEAAYRLMWQRWCATENGPLA